MNKPTYVCTISRIDGTRITSVFSSTRNLAQQEALRFLKAEKLDPDAVRLTYRKIFE